MSSFRLIPAPFTPFDSKTLAINEEAVDLTARAYKGDGIGTVFINGTTAEFASLTFDERVKLAELWVEAGKSHGIKVIVHVGHACLKESQELARHACHLGADAIAAVAPYYFKPASMPALVESIRAIADACSDCPFYYYDLPELTGVNFPADEFLRKAREVIPNFKGIKFSKGDLFEFQRLQRESAGDYELFFGKDEILLSALSLGATGAVGSTYNFLAKTAFGIVDEFNRSNIKNAQVNQQTLTEMVQLLAAQNYLPAAKYVMSRLKVDCGPARLPFLPLTEAETGDIEAALDRMALDEVPVLN